MSKVPEHRDKIDLAMHQIATPEEGMEAYYITDFVTSDEQEYLIRKICESPQPKWKQLANRRLQIWGGEITPRSTLIPQTLPSFVTSHPDIIGRIRDTGVFATSKHGQPNHVIMNEYHPGQGIMPHEDGSAYHPVVATLSLASHAVFHYYQYRPDSGPSPGTGEVANESPSTSQGRSIDPQPVLSVFLEPKSLIITRSSLYTHYLHGIDGVHDDLFQSDSSDAVCSSINSTSDEPGLKSKLANFTMLSDDTKRSLTGAQGADGARLRRGTRYSLTCRDVEKVAAKAFNIRV